MFTPKQQPTSKFTTLQTVNHKQLINSKFPSPAIITQHLLQFTLLLLYYVRLGELTGNAIKYNCILDILNTSLNSTEKHISRTA